jgi:adenosylcobinamide amidohydrolase
VRYAIPPMDSDGMPLLSSPFAGAVRRGRHLVVSLRAPAVVLSTCSRNGGLRRDIAHLVNHQSCEPVRHQERFELIVGMGEERYHAHVCAELGLEPAHTVVAGTAAAMQYAGVAARTWEDLAVTAIVTAGVSGNAGCAGDPADYDERDGAWVRATPDPAAAAPKVGGTINTVLLLSSPFSDTALARAVVTMAEAKASALQELAVGSRRSTRLATGTGTDQYALACPREGGRRRTWTGKHTKAGELIGLTVREATLEALRWQNGLEKSYTRSILHALGRFGLTEDAFKAAQKELLTEREYQFLVDNRDPVVHEPQLSAACFAFAAVLDRVLAGTLGSSAAREALVNQAGLMAAGLSARPGDFASFRGELAAGLDPADERGDALVPAAMRLVNRAIALGWRNKWAARA